MNAIIARAVRAIACALCALTCSRALTAQAPTFESSLQQRELRWLAAPVDSGQARPHAVMHSDLYYTRLKIHRIGSYAMLPLFAGEYVLGNKLLNESVVGARPPRTLRSEHATVAAGIGVLFGVNTVTGLWNLWDSRHETEHRTLRYTHSALLLASDAAMVWAGASASGARRTVGGPQRHRNIALGAFGLSTIGTVIMWLWN